MNEVGMNNEWMAMRMRRDYLREQCATEVEAYMHLLNCVGPNLKAAYMIALGQYEHRIFHLKTDVSRWQRRFTLRQAALNRGEKPDFCLIESMLDAEFKDYMEKVKEHLAALKAAVAHESMSRFSEAECTEIRVLYLNAVKKLHPDLNPNLGVHAKELWLRIQDAHAGQDWEGLRLLTSMVDDVVGGRKELQPVESFAALKVEVGRLEKKLKGHREQRASLQRQKPYCWESLLADEGDVERRRDVLLAEIGELEEAVSAYEQLWKENRKECV